MISSKKRNTKFNFILIITAILITGTIDLFSAQVEYKRYDRQDMGVFYKEAEKYKEEIKWQDVVEKGKEIVKSEWEKRMWEEIARDLKEGAITEDDVDRIILENTAEWEADAYADSLIEKGGWIARKKTEEIEDEIKNEEEINEFREWARQTEEDLEMLDLNGGLERWALHLRNITEQKNQKRTAVRNRIEEKIQQELSAIFDPAEKNLVEKGLREEMERIASEFEMRWEWEADATWIRNRNNWLMNKTRDESMRKEYESKRAEVVAERIIGETKENADKSIEEALNTEVDKEEWDSSVQYRQYEKAIADGLKEWNKALDAFYRNWNIWREDTHEQFEEGQRQWEMGYELIKQERDTWLLRTEERIREGLREWDDKWQEVEEARQEAETELTRYIQIQKESWENHIAGIEDVLISGSGILAQAEDNLTWLNEMKQKYLQEWNQVEAQYNTWQAKAEEMDQVLIEKKYEELKEAFMQGTRKIEIYIVKMIPMQPSQKVLKGTITYSGVIT
ncbi:MAG: hypothetical protein KKH98_09480, partial [Spirochaetes bacterium]|nr:hypothetical protein [Spirochaetota bacterium]